MELLPFVLDLITSCGQQNLSAEIFSKMRQYLNIVAVSEPAHAGKAIEVMKQVFKMELGIYSRQKDIAVWMEYLRWLKTVD